MKKLKAGLVVIVLAFVGYVMFVPQDMYIESKAVAVDDIAKLIACVSADNCKVPRDRYTVEGQQFWSVTVTDQDLEIHYFLGDDNSVKVMLTVEDNPIMVEDYGYVGVVSRITELSQGKPRVTQSGDPEFESLFPVAQFFYYKAMEQAKEHILPESRRAPKKETRFIFG